MSLGRSSRFCPLGPLRWNLRKYCLPLHLHCPSLFIMVERCVARILGMDVGKTLMTTEMLKFLRAHSVTRLYPRYQLGCASRLPSCSITIVSFPNWVCHFPEPLQIIIMNCSISEEIVSCGISFRHHWVEWRSRKQGYQDQHEARNQRSYEGQLDHEDCNSSSPLFLLPYAWISGRDSCLVGVSCHIPSSGLLWAS